MEYEKQVLKTNQSNINSIKTDLDLLEECFTRKKLKYTIKTLYLRADQVWSLQIWAERTLRKYVESTSE